MEQNRNLKFEKISKLSEETSALIIQDANEWKNYLTTAGQVYKYPFCDQLLIHAQRPDATACASLEIWNEKMQCRVNRGAKGIALIDADSKYPKLKYVFDISDVHKEKNVGRYPYLWEFHEEHKEIILAQLEKTYGMSNPQIPFEKRIIEISKAVAADSCKDLMVGGNFPETIEDFEVESTLASSIAYTVLSRCGIEMELWEKELDFQHIGKFNTQNDLSVIGNANTEICNIQTAHLKYPQTEQFSMKIGNKIYGDKKEAGTALMELCKQIKSIDMPSLIGEYAGFKMFVSFNSFYKRYEMNLKGQLSHNLEIGFDPLGNIVRMNHILESMEKDLAKAEAELGNVKRQLETAKTEVTKPFAQEAELAKKLERLTKLNVLLNMDEKNDDLEKGGEPMDLSELDGLWNDSNDGEKQPEADTMTQKDVILVDVVHNEEHRYFRYDNAGLEEIKEQLRHTDRPMVDLTGEVITLPEFAQLEQSSKVSLSLTVNMDDRTIKAYETNNIPEDLRMDDNISIKTYPMNEYLNDRKVPEKEKLSVLDRLHQNQKQLQDRKTPGQEPIHKNHETVK